LTGAVAFAAGADEAAIRRPSWCRTELDLIPAEPVTAADLPDTLVARLVRIEGLLAAERDDPQRALIRFAEAESAWRRRLGPGGLPGDAVCREHEMAEPHTKFHAEAACAAPAGEVWKLLYDPVRFARWWPGWERIEPGEGSAAGAAARSALW
jgi:hypothetical protein